MAVTAQASDGGGGVRTARSIRAASSALGVVGLFIGWAVRLVLVPALAGVERVEVGGRPEVWVALDRGLLALEALLAVAFASGPVALAVSGPAVVHFAGAAVGALEALEDLGRQACRALAAGVEAAGSASWRPLRASGC